MAGNLSSNAGSIDAIEQALLSHHSSRIVGSHSAPVSNNGSDGKVRPIIDILICLMSMCGSYPR